ncbi:MAG: EAL domain-containing protein, partial [Gammaproteobacteria bacterium]|nr:EAL domain-containing protein [Gammaproteobacteria bacterium]
MLTTDHKSRRSDRSALVSKLQPDGTEFQVQRSEQRFRDFAEIAVDVFWETDVKLRLVYLSDAYEKFTGIHPSQVLGCSYREMVERHAADHQAIERHFAVLEARLPYRDFEYCWRHVDGTEHMLLTSGKPFYGVAGEFQGYRGVAREITAAKSAEQALRDSQKRFKDFAEIAVDVFWETDADLRFRHVPESCRNIMGIGPEQMIGWTHPQVLNDYIDDPDKIAHHFGQLEARLPYQDFEYNWKHPDGTIRVLRSSGKPFYSPDNAFQGYRGVARDVTEAHYLTRRITYQATHDALTGLVNRHEFERRLERALESARSRSLTHALCFLDLDQFKIINDSAGHIAGDALLKRVAEVLKEQLRSRDTLARVGGDEFALLAENCTTEKAKAIADSLVSTIREFRFVWEGRTFEVGISVGLVPITPQSESVVQLLSLVDVACYTAKDLGRNRVHVYQETDKEAQSRHSEILRAAELINALERERFRLYCQPIIALHNGSDAPAVFEVLIRMLDDENNIVMPSSFIPAAERYGLMSSIDRWVIRNVLGRHASDFMHFPDAGIAINLSGITLNDEGFGEFVKQQLAESVLDAKRVCFEITETTAVRNFDRVTQFIHEMKKVGCMFALDDFGSGLSSFAYLKNLAVDYLKIDGSFIQNFVEDPIDHAITIAINRVGHIKKILTIA